MCYASQLVYLPSSTIHKGTGAHFKELLPPFAQVSVSVSVSSSHPYHLPFAVQQLGRQLNVFSPEHIVFTKCIYRYILAGFAFNLN